MSKRSSVSSSSVNGKSSSDLRRAFSEDGANKTHVGGQALLEGVMMRGKYNWAAAIRTPEGGIYTEEHDLASGKKKNKWMTLPLIRGCVALVESLALGYKALEVATEHAFDKFDMSYHAYKQEGLDPALATDEERARAAGYTDEEIEELLKDVTVVEETQPRDVEPVMPQSTESTQPTQSVLKSSNSSPDQPKETEPTQPQNSLTGGLMTVSMLLGVVLGVVLFIVAPAAITNLIVGEYDSKTILWNIVDGVIRVAIFVFYLWLIGRMKDIKRMFAYHGAEHKTIHCFEHGLELTPENAAQFPRLHIRCGTAFLIMVMILAILVYTIIPVNALIDAWGVPEGAPKLALVIATRIIFMPIIAGLAYEVNVKWAGQHPNNPLVRVVLWPGLQMQYLTTHEPDASMLECAIASMKLVLVREKAEATKVNLEEAEMRNVKTNPTQPQKPHAKQIVAITT